MPDAQDVDPVAADAIENLKRISYHRDQANVGTLGQPRSYLRRAADALDHVKKRRWIEFATDGLAWDE
jgi:hypothetical protein